MLKEGYWNFINKLFFAELRLSAVVSLTMNFIFTKQEKQKHIKIAVHLTHLEDRF
jgi:hypothetical protein